MVEIDESKFGRRKYHRGRLVDGHWVFGGFERGSKDSSFMMVVPDRSKNTLMPIITQYIRSGTTIISDEWRAYSDIGISGYTHLTVNHAFPELCESSHQSTHKWSGGARESDYKVDDRSGEKRTLRVPRMPSDIHCLRLFVAWPAQ